MNRFVKRGARRGFTFVELLAVVLILAVLAGVAIPMYINSRRSAAARACKANIRAIASAESAYYLRNSSWTTIAGLVNQPEGLAKEAVCPLNNKTYTVGTSGNFTLECQDKAEHAAVVGATTDYELTMTPPAKESIP